jgi:GNAT superfamily N-acetyltransferase
MTISVAPEKLSDYMIEQLQQEVKKSINITLFDKRTWNTYETVYVARENDNFVGVCVVDPIENYYKLGPFIVLSEYQGKGYGAELFEQVIKNLEGKTLFVGSSNPAVRKIIGKHGFETLPRKNVPKCLKVYFLKYMLKVLDAAFLWDAFKKWVVRGRGRYSIYVRAS